MNNVPYTSIKSVLYDISTMMEPDQWDESRMTEWAIRGLKKMNIGQQYKTEVCIAEIKEHKAQLPTDIVHINQIAVNTYVDTDTTLLEKYKEHLGLSDTCLNAALKHMTFPDNLAIKALQASYIPHNWMPMKTSTNTFFKTVTNESEYFQIPVQMNNSCVYEYTLDPTMCLTTNVKEGYLMVSYKTYAKDDCGNTLIPDHADLKEALFHFCMYRYFMSKAMAHEQGASQSRDFHLSMWQTQSLKATGSLNFPTIDELENTSNQLNNLVPRSGQYEEFFGRLGYSKIPNF